MTQENAPTANKATRCLELIRAGGATRDSLLTALDVTKAGLATQFAYLNNRGLSMVEALKIAGGDINLAEFPIQNEDKTFRIGTFAEYEAKKKVFGATPAKPKTVKEIVDGAQKREDKASAAYTKADEKAKASPDNVIFAKMVELRRVELELASLKLSAVQNGDYSHENVIVAENGANDESVPKSKKGKVNTSAPEDVNNEFI